MLTMLSSVGSIKFPGANNNQNLFVKITRIAVGSSSDKHFRERDDHAAIFTQ